jgi:RNA-directed DNA polymerase
LANVFLHYVLDLWVHRWRKQAHGLVSVVRYADDFVMAFESEADARKMLAGLTERLAKFGLALHEDKTRLIMFGKYAAERRRRIGMGRPETFDFLGFTHYCATSRDGRFVVKRKTQRKWKIRKLHELRVEARRRMHHPIAKQHKGLSTVPCGHFAYFGLSSNVRSMVGFAYEVRRLWQRALARRSQRSMTWDRFNRLLRAFPLPTPSITRAWNAKSTPATR